MIGLADPEANAAGEDVASVEEVERRKGKAEGELELLVTVADDVSAAVLLVVSDSSGDVLKKVPVTVDCNKGVSALVVAGMPKRLFARLSNGSKMPRSWSGAASTANTCPRRMRARKTCPRRTRARENQSISYDCFYRGN